MINILLLEVIITATPPAEPGGDSRRSESFILLRSEQ